MSFASNLLVAITWAVGVVCSLAAFIVCYQTFSDYFGSGYRDGAIACLGLTFVILLIICILACVVMFSSCGIPLDLIATIGAAIAMILSAIAYGFMHHGLYIKINAGEWTSATLCASLLLFLYSLEALLG
ncbi:hypothetical protein FGIG_04754 [Fasciola gigantica]|uniref:MARVEL domain-containing protein n=1 Tax=Fasciola gigantica TaxID=46835 RepID=A0A504WSR0_FASGI|nr:hypothetical protein FGIG_04754 [Fasciola gigantica]